VKIHELSLSFSLSLSGAPALYSSLRPFSLTLSAALQIVPTCTCGGLGPLKARADGCRVSSKHIQLNHDLVAAARSGEGRRLCALVATRWQDFNAVNAATAYRSLLLMRTSRGNDLQQDAGQAPHSAREEVLATLEPVLREQHVQAFGARECSNILHTLAKTPRRRPCAEILHALEARALKMLGGFKSQEIANTLWAFATLARQPDDKLIAGLTARAVKVQGDFKPQEITNTLWAFATLRRQPDKELVSGLTAWALEVRGDFNPQSIANMLWAFATLGKQPDDKLVAGLMAQTVKVQGDFNSQDIANTMWAFATLGTKPDNKLVAGLMARAVEIQSDFNSQEIANTMWAFATLGLQPNDKLVAGLAARALEVQGDLKPQNIANTLWAFATLGIQPDDKLVAGLTARAVEVQGNFNPQTIANTLWAFATLGIQPEKELLEGLTARALVLQDDLNSQDIANMLWAFATLGRQPDEKLMAGLTARAVEVQGDFNPQEIANTLWAFATLGLQPSKVLLGGLSMRALVLWNDLNPQSIANMMWAFAKLGIQPDEKLMVGLTARAAKVQGNFNPQEIANILWAVCFLSIRSPAVVSRLVHALELQILSLATARVLDPQFQRQLHQFFVACNVDEGLRAGVPATILALRETVGPGCHAAFVEQVTQASRSQQQVSETLRGMRLSVQDEAECPRSGYSFDMRVYNTSVLGQSVEDSRHRAADGWVVEFDGPWHFFACRSPTGATLIKRHQLVLLGYTLVSIPYWEWARLGAGVGKQEQYLLGRLLMPTQLASSMRASKSNTG